MDKKKILKSDKSLRGSASQFCVAGELCRRGYVAVITMGNCPNTDILCSNKEGTKFIHIQVKTFRPSDKDCSVGVKAENNYGNNFIWILAGIPMENESNEYRYYIIPSPIMAKNVSEMHRIWMNTPGKKGQAHNVTNFRSVQFPPKENENKWDITKYLNRWDIIGNKLD